MSNKITLHDSVSGKTLELPLLEGTEGPSVFDISSLYRELGYFTFDPGFQSTASCRSAVTFIDGEKGILLYRGYPVDQLAEKSSFLRVAYLLIYGELPTPEQHANFNNELRHYNMIKESLKRFYDGFYHDAHPMAIMVGVVGSLSAFYHDSTDIHNLEHRKIAAYRMIAKMPTIAAACYKHCIGEPMVYPDNSLSYAGNVLHMMFSQPTEKYVINPVAEKALDRIFILHADHEQNASTSTVRLAGSSQANPFACIASGIAALWGPAHGGANEAVLTMLEEIGDISHIPEFIAKAKDKNDPFRLMGFGHRVYKNFDPRATLIRETCHEVLNELDSKNDPLFKIALALEEAALKDDYFIQRNLYPNVDFYSGLIYKAIGIPNNMFTVMFAIARTTGWIAQWMEMISEPNQRIGRPRQLYVGAERRNIEDGL